MSFVSRPRRAFSVLLLLTAIALPAIAQDDVTTHNATSGFDGTWVTGPASNPLNWLNGPGARTSGPSSSYDFPDFAPITDLDQHLPRWIQFGLEERFRVEGYTNSGYKPGNDDSYFLNRFRFQMMIRPTSWFKIVGQVQDGRPY